MDICPSLGNSMTSQTSATFFALILIWLLHVLIAAPYYTIQPDGQTWPCAIIFTHQYLLWWSENCKTQADVFQRVVREPNVSCVELLDLSNQQQQQQGYAWYRRSRRRCSLGQKFLLWPIDGQTHAAPHHFFTQTCQTLFVPFRRPFLCLLDAS